MTDLNATAYRTITFDCYGTLIDWEAGILAAAEAQLPGVDRPADEILETFARFETEEEALAGAMRILSDRLGRDARLRSVWRNDPGALGGPPSRPRARPSPTGGSRKRSPAGSASTGPMMARTTSSRR